MGAIAALAFMCVPAFGQGLQGPNAGSNNPAGGGFQAYIPAAYGNVGSHFHPVSGINLHDHIRRRFHGCAMQHIHREPIGNFNPNGFHDNAGRDIREHCEL
jgi:hypothetical protein